MRKIHKYIALLLIGGMTSFSACTDNFESDNASKTAFTEELQEYDYQKFLLKFEILQTGIYFNYNWGAGTNWPFQVMQNLGQDMFSGYFHDMNQSFNDKNSSYALNDGWTASNWNNTYSYIMPEVIKCEEVNKEQPSLLGIAGILKVTIMHRISDVYGPVVYTKFGQEGDNVDTQEAVYKQFFLDLDNAQKLLDEFILANPDAEPFASTDLLMPAGKRNLKQWMKYANSLRLRLAMRISNVSKDLAKAEAAKALDNSYGMLEGADETVAVNAKSGKYTNPLGEINLSWSEVYMGATMESVLNGYKDPRMSKFYSPATSNKITWKDETGEYSLNTLFPIVGTYKGVPQGTGLTTKDNRYIAHSKSTVSQSTDAILMTAAEVWFLRAEAALRGYTSEAAKMCYETGVRTSFDQWGVSGADTYLASHNVPADYKDAFDVKYNMQARITTTPNWDDAAGQEQQLEKIATQKWLAMYPEGGEAWTEQRRTGYPKLFQVFVNNSAGAISTDAMIRRLFYPADLQTSSASLYSALKTALGGADTGGTRLWWDAGQNNF